MLLQHPYESFSTSVERFLREASEDPKVRAIKMTLYRTSSDSKILDYLSEAARNGKQVAVVVELKARFDEAANIQFASRLEEVGIHVTYGVVGLKTHCKVILVVRQDYNGLRRYAHIGTGNYHAGHGAHLQRLRPAHLRRRDRPGPDRAVQLPDHRLPAEARLPASCCRRRRCSRRRCSRRSSARSRAQRAGAPGLIQFKMNALEDVDITRALYRASQAGVKVDLIVRDTCRLRPGVPGLSENVRVVSIVGRFLEHGRIYYFRNGGEEEYFIGSADCMKRNLESRVEVVVPVEDPALRQELRAVLDAQLAPDAAPGRCSPTAPTCGRARAARSSQQVLIDLAEKRQKEASRRRKRRPRGFARRAAK